MASMEASPTTNQLVAGWSSKGYRLICRHKFFSPIFPPPSIAKIVIPQPSMGSERTRQAFLEVNKVLEVLSFMLESPTNNIFYRETE